MMIASNNGVGTNIGFPDVCLTPAAPAPIPLPYPNLAMNAMAVPFSPNIFVGFMPSVNMASTIPMTSGDEAGVAHPLFKMMGRYTMGNPTILVNCVPAINMLCPTTGNMMNNPIGAALVPSVSTTFYTDSALTTDGAKRQGGAPMHGEGLARLREVSSGDDEDLRVDVMDGVARIRILRFSSCTGARVFSALRAAREVRSLVFDVRGNPGGDVDGCLGLLEDLLPRGVVMVLREDADGDRASMASRHTPEYDQPVVVVVDGQSASAAEIFAAALSAHGRALVLGSLTAGKTTAQTVVRSNDGMGRVYTDVARFLRHDGVEIHAVGVAPDAPLEGGIDEAMRVARGLAGETAID